MDKKYWVPALDKANAILDAVTAAPGKKKLIELSRELGIHKSSMFSLLHTMEALGWLKRESGDTYVLGDAFARYGYMHYRQDRLIERFHKEAASVMREIGETIQLARLEGSEVFYLALAEAPTLVRLASEPGMRFPAHQTGLGKCMLADLPDHAVRDLYTEQSLPAATPQSIRTIPELLTELGRIRDRQGVAFDLEESVIGFCCAAAPIRNEEGTVIAGVSCSMPRHQWERKREEAARLIRKLAADLSAPLPQGGS